VSGFPWITLITATAPVVAALGAVGLRERYTTLREQASAKSALVTARRHAIQEAYVGVIKSGRALAADYRNIDWERLARHTNDANDAWDRILELTREFHGAIALVELIGSHQAQAVTAKMVRTTNPDNRTGQDTGARLQEEISGFVAVVRNENEADQLSVSDD